MQCAIIWTRKKQSGDADTTNKEERLKTNKLSCGSIHSVHESLVDVLVSFHMLQVIPHVVGLVALCAEFTCCQCTKLIQRCCLYRSRPVASLWTQAPCDCSASSLDPVLPRSGKCAATDSHISHRSWYITFLPPFWIAVGGWSQSRARPHIPLMVLKNTVHLFNTLEPR